MVAPHDGQTVPKSKICLACADIFLEFRTCWNQQWCPWRAKGKSKTLWSVNLHILILNIVEERRRNQNDNLLPAGIEPATLCVWGTCDNHYTTETLLTKSWIFEDVTDLNWGMFANFGYVTIHTVTEKRYNIPTFIEFVYCRAAAFLYKSPSFQNRQNHLIN